jgi:hypothetical protein
MDMDVQDDPAPNTAALSYAQERQFARRAAGQPAMALQLALRIEGPLDVSAFVETLRIMVDRHDALRIRIAADSRGFPRQWLAPGEATRAPVRPAEVKARSDEQFAAYAARVRAASRGTPWDPAGLPPFRFALLRRSAELHAFLADFSPLAIDGPSRSVFGSELWTTYAAVTDGHPLPYQAPAGDLLAMVRRQRATYDDRSCTANHAYWARKFEVLRHARRQLTGADESADAHPVGCHTRSVLLDAAALGRIGHAREATRSSLFQWVASRFASEVFRRTDRGELEVSVPMDTRAPGDRGLMGQFAASFPLLIQGSGYPDEILHSVKDEIMMTMRHRHIAHDDFRRAGGTHLAARTRGAVHLRSDIHAPESSETVPAGLRVMQNAFHDREHYTCDGLNLTVEEFADRARLVLDFDPRDHTSADADDFAHALSAALYATAAPAGEPRS